MTHFFLSVPRLRVAAAAAMFPTIVGCGSIQRNPIPIDELDSAVIAGMPGVLAWGGAFSEVFQEDLVRVWAIAERTDLDFHYVGIPEDWVSRATEMFDPVEMRRLFDLGYGMALEDEPWETELPTFKR